MRSPFDLGHPLFIAQADSLQNLLRSGDPDSNRVNILLKLSKFYLSKPLGNESNLNRARILTTQAEELSQQITFTKGLEEVYFLKGKINIKQQKKRLVLEMLKNGSDTNRIRLLLELGKQHLRPTYTHDANWDSALSCFLKAEAISTRIKNQQWKEECQALIGISYLLKNDWQNGKAYFMQIINSRRQAGDKAGEMRAWLRMATTRFCGDCRENVIFLTNALVLSRQLGDKAQEALILLELGYKYLQLNRGNTRQAEQEAIQALEIQKALGYKAIYRAYHVLAAQSVYHMPSDYGYLSNAYYLLSDIGQVKGDLNKKLLYILEIVQGLENNGMHEELDYAYFRLGNAYFELGQYDKTIEYYQKSLAISHQKGEIFIQLGLPRRMATALLKAGKATEALLMLEELTRKNLPYTYEDKMFIDQSLGACYNAIRKYLLAEKYYLQSVVWSKQTALQFQLNTWRSISQFYVANARYANAEPYLKRLLTASPEQIIPSHLIEVYLMQFKVDSAQGNYLSAIKHYQRYKALNDSVFNETKSKQITQLSIQYETGKKEQQLKLKEKNISLLTEQSKSQQTQRNALIIGTLLLLAMLVLGYNRYRSKRLSNQQLEAQQQKLLAQHEELQAQQEKLQSQQKEILDKNAHLSQLLSEKDSLLIQKDILLTEKDSLLAEKEWLLKEIHHRVKNNLQIVMSLLNSQAATLEDKAVLSAIRESQHRVQAMALIHQKLYQSEGVGRINMALYINDVVSYLHESYCFSQPIHLSVEPIELDVTIAVPLGLIINEAITNSFKYAFPNGRPGTTILALRSLAKGRYELTIADDGVGLPQGFDPSSSRSLGMTLLHGFSAQLGGELTITSKAGLCIRLTFQQKPLGPMNDHAQYS